ncbi:S41 family peptidase [Otoolea muris]|uniref:S41 family peptidase n=1 Tax=Otoolea muris TaxID=2941515 RepID=UPI00203B66B7|nr:S41 family peptidase [Otoolea muris]
MDNRNKFWKGVMVGVLVTAFTCFVTVGASTAIYMFGQDVMGNQAGAGPGREEAGRNASPAGEGSGELDLERISEKLSQIEDLVDELYLFEDQIEPDKGEAGVYQGFIFGLNDPYAAYYTPEELASFMDETKGTYCGIGAMVSQDVRTQISTIVRVFEGSPAEEAGILPGDVIYKVDGELMAGVDLTLLVNNYVKGEEGSQVAITVYREDTGEYVDLTVTRRFIDVQTVSGKMLEDGIGYVSVIEFDEVTAKQFKDKIEDLRGQGMERLIIDLRDNPGGELNTVVSMADYLIGDGGRILTISDKYGNEEIYKAEDGHSLDIPMVVLVNENSASASEVLTGALKDYDAATVVGTQTFGKGIVQSLIPLSDGSAVKLTTSHYYTPGGLDIHGKGISPDVEVELGDEARRMAVLPQELDNQLQKGIEVIKDIRE